jgi:hypothetical protein
VPVPLIAPAPVVFAVCLFLLGLIAAESAALPRHVWWAPPPERGPPVRVT